jgi:hypothetical protein
MLGHLAYLAALNAPEIASAASDASGGLIESVGRRLAAGMGDEIASRLSAGGDSLLGAALGGLRGLAGTAANEAQGSMSAKLAEVLGGVNASLVSSEELALLREIAAAAATKSDTSDAVERLKRFHQKPDKA